MNLRHRLAIILETDHGRDHVSRVVDVALVTIILLNVAAIILESVPDMVAVYGDWFETFEVVSIVIFSVEYLLRVWSAPDIAGRDFGAGLKGRLRYMATPLALIDLLAILPFYLSLLIPIDLRFLRIIRLLRIFKLTRYSSAMQVMLAVLHQEATSLVAAMFVMMILLVRAASGIYLLEHKIQPEVFGTIPQSMWWAMVTMATVGYGDVVPVTALGKVFAGFIILLSTAMVALPAGILASGFSEQLRQRREQYNVMLREALKDGEITEEEIRALERVRKNLGLRESDAELLMQFAKRAALPPRCPHCHEVIGRRQSDFGH